MGSQRVRRMNDPDFKREAVRVVLENPDKSKAQIARELGTDPKALYAWMQEHRKRDDAAFPGNGKSTDEVVALRRELKLVTQERDILKNAIGTSLNGRNEIREAGCIEQHRSRWPVVLQCRVLHVSRNAFYTWTRGHISVRKAQDTELMPLIGEIHEATGHTYGAEWIAKELRKNGRTVGKDRVRRLMKVMSLKVQCKQSFTVHGTTQPSPPTRTTLHRILLSVSSRAQN